MSCRPRTPSSKRSGFIEPWRKYLPTPWVASAPENGPGGEGACHQAPVAPHGKVCSPARAYTGARFPWLSGQTQSAPNLAEEAANLPARRHGAGAGKGSIAGHPRQGAKFSLRRRKIRSLTPPQPAPPTWLTGAAAAWRRRPPTGETPR
jgi:hypothetical protein